MKSSPLSGLVLLEDGEPALLDLAVHDGVGGDDDGADVLGVSVVLVSDFKDQFFGEVANFDPIRK